MRVSVSLTPHRGSSAASLSKGFDFTDPDLYAKRLPVGELAELRRAAPIWWNEQSLDTGGFHDGGFWVVTKRKEVKEVSRRSDVFSSSWAGWP
jgi:cholest-4-en-3-one 26-monooxygenase